MKLITKLIARFLLNECDPKEQQKVERQIESDESLSKDVSKFQQLLSMKLKRLQITDVDTRWQLLRRDLEQLKQEHDNQSRITRMNRLRNRRMRFQSILRYAAVFVLALGLGYLFEFQPIHFPWTKSAVEYKVVTVGTQERVTLTLSDGSQITLDAGSELKYPSDFRENREVYLRGEAFFDVAHDEARPFQVHAGEALVRVLGTRFNVRNWSDNNKVIVTVDEGKVSLQPMNTEVGKKVILTKSQQSTLERDGHPTDPITVNSEKYFLWMNNEIHFENATVKEVLNQLQRWYGFNFNLMDTSMLNHSLTIHIQKTTVNDVLKLIGIITDTNVIRDGNNITFVKN